MLSSLDSIACTQFDCSDLPLELRLYPLAMLVPKTIVTQKLAHAIHAQVLGPATPDLLGYVNELQTHLHAFRWCFSGPSFLGHLLVLLRTV